MKRQKGAKTSSQRWKLPQIGQSEERRVDTGMEKKETLSRTGALRPKRLLCKGRVWVVRPGNRSA